MICAPALRLARLLLAAAAIAIFAGFANVARAETFEFAVWFSDRDFYADDVRHLGVGNRKADRGPSQDQAAFLWRARRGEGNRQRGAHRRGRRRHHQRELRRRAGPAGFLLRGAVLDSRAIPRSPSIRCRRCCSRSRTLMEQRGLKLMFNFPRPGWCRTAPTGHIKAPPTGRARRCARPDAGRACSCSAVGASAVALDPGEVYVALQQKTVDCILFLANLTLSSKVYEVAPHITFGATAPMLDVLSEFDAMEQGLAG